MATGTITSEEQKQLSSTLRTAATPPAAIDNDARRKVVPLGAPLAISGILSDKEAPYHPSPGVDQRLIDGIEGAEEFAGYLTPAKHALSFASEALKTIDEAWIALRKDTSLTDALRALRLEPGATKKHDAIMRAFSNANENLHGAVKHIEDQLNAPVVSAATTPAAAELRGVLRSMPEKDRHDAIGKAIKDGDDAIIHAVLGSHPLASGTDPLRHQMWTRQVREARHPELVRRLAATHKAIGILERAAPIALGEVERAARFKFAEVAKLKAKATASQSALDKLI